MTEIRVNGYRCTHPSVLALAEGDKRPVEEIVRALARETLEEANALLLAVDENWSPPPFDPFLIAQVLGIRCVETTHSGLEDAMLLVKNGVPTILYRKHRIKSRIRFSVFHEIAHTLFPNYEETVQFRKKRRFALFEPEGQLESLCDLAAAEMLMPRDLFLDDLDRRGFGVTRVSWLQKRYGASLEAVCLRMAKLSTVPCAILRLTYRRQKPKSHEKKYVPGQMDGVMKNMRVIHSAVSDGFVDQISKHIAVPGTSCIHKAAWEGCATDGEEVLDLGGGSRCYRVDVRALSSRREQLFQPVCAFLYPT